MNRKLANDRYQFDAPLQLYKTAESADVRLCALKSIGNTNDPKLLKRLLELARSDTIKDQDVLSPL